MIIKKLKEDTHGFNGYLTPPAPHCGLNDKNVFLTKGEFLIQNLEFIPLLKNESRTKNKRGEETSSFFLFRLHPHLTQPWVLGTSRHAAAPGFDFHGFIVKLLCMKH